MVLPSNTTGSGFAHKARSAAMNSSACWYRLSWSIVTPSRSKSPWIPPGTTLRSSRPSLI
jgi:hypothetical protein